MSNPPSATDSVSGAAHSYGVQAANTATHHANTAQGYTQQTRGNTQDALEKLERDLEAKTNEAVEEGQADVSAVAQGYLQQALSMLDGGIVQTNTLLTQGKEQIARQHQGEHPPTGIVASLTSTAAAALDAAQRGLGTAQQTLHQNAPAFQHASHPGPNNAVGVPAAPVGQALSNNAAAAHAAVQPHLDSAQATVQPHYEAAQAAVQPHLQAAQAAAQPHIDAAAATAKPYIDSAVTGAQGQYDAAKSAATPYAAKASDTAQFAVSSAQATLGSYTSSGGSNPTPYTQVDPKV